VSNDWITANKLNWKRFGRKQLSPDFNILSHNLLGMAEKKHNILRSR
jgi:hypothetical protein